MTASTSRTSKKRDLRRNIAVVLQDVFLFSETIAKNVALNDDIEGTVIEDALKNLLCPRVC